MERFVDNVEGFEMYPEMNREPVKAFKDKGAHFSVLDNQRAAAFRTS